MSTCRGLFTRARAAGPPDADGDAAGPSPNSLNRIYGSCVPCAPGMMACQPAAGCLPARGPGGPPDADGDTAGPSPNSLNRIYGSCVPCAPGMMACQPAAGCLPARGPGGPPDADGDTAGPSPNSLNRIYGSCVPCAPVMIPRFRECRGLFIPREGAILPHDKKNPNLFQLRPRRSNAVHPCISDELPHVFVGVDEYAQVDPIDLGIHPVNFYWPLQVTRFCRQTRRLHSLNGALQPVDDLCLLGDGLLHVWRRNIGRQLRPSPTQQVKVCQRHMHIDLAHRAYARSGPPVEFLCRSRLRQRNQLSARVVPLAVIALPEAFQLRVQGGCRKN